MTANRLFYKNVAKEFLFLVAAILLYRLSGGWAAYAIAAFGCVAALRHKTGRAFACLMVLFLIVVGNPFIIATRTPLAKYALRGGTFLIPLSLALAGGQGGGRFRLPLGGLFAYLAVCSISSATGWMPVVSYMKIFLYGVFLLALIVSARNLQISIDELQLLRHSLVAASFYVIIGSLALWPFPQWSSLGAIITMRDPLADFGLVEDMVAGGMYLGQALLCGVLSHSQTLGSVCCCAFAFIVADMIFVERRIVAIHALLAGSALVVTYLTRSRTALVAMVFSFFVIVLASRRVMMTALARSRIEKLILQGVLVVIIAGAFFEFRHNTMSKWLRKKNSVAGDDRTMIEAVTESRQGLIEKSMRDFHLNPVFGMGFQVEERHRYHIKGYSGHGLILSASVEKGLLPLMVLGESGIVGSLVFIIFLISFYHGCGKGKLIVTGALFAVLLVANMGEATFFSIGGAGGMQWLLTVMGGFVADMMILVKQANPMALSLERAKHVVV